MRVVIITFVLLTLSIFAQNDKNVVSIIFDTSGSMKYNNNDLKMKKYLISTSKAIYSLNNELTDINLNFLLAEFNNNGKIHYNAPLKTEQQLKQVEKIINDVKVDSKAGTDYHKGLATVIETIKKDYPNSQIKPLFITDGIDEGKGVLLGYDYTPVSHTDFLLVKNIDSIKDKNVIDRLELWKKAIPNSNYKVVDKISDIQDELFYTLITSINSKTKLLRYGELKILGETLTFQKHNDDGVIIFLFSSSKPKSIKNVSNITISEISENLYKIKFSGVKGIYNLIFDKKPIKNRYLSIETSDISNKISFTPEKSQKIIINSQVGFNINFFDKTTKSEIDYKDFLNLIYLEVKIENEAKENIYNQLFEKQNPIFSKSFAKGKYNIFAKWSYSKKHLTSQNFEQIDSFETSEDGVLVNLNYNFDSIWEYKEEKILITIDKTPKKIINSIEIELISENNVVDKIILNKIEENKYEGIIPPLKANVYFMNILKSNDSNLAPSKNSKIEFKVKPRVLTWEAIENGNKSIFEKNNITKEIELPYFESFSFNSTFKAIISPIFENEKILITCQASGKQNYKEELTTYTFKLLSSTSTSEDAITSEINCPSITELTKDNNTFEIISSLTKKEGGIDLKQLTPQTYVTFNFKLISTKEFQLNDSSIIVNASVDSFNKTLFNAKIWALWVSLIIGLLLLLLLILFIIILNITHKRNLYKIWARIHNTSLKDFWDSSDFGCLLSERKLSIPSNFKNKSFDDNREDFIKFINLNLTSDRNKILGKLKKTYSGFAFWSYLSKRKELRDYVETVTKTENVPSKWKLNEMTILITFKENLNNAVRLRNQNIPNITLNSLGEKIRVEGVTSEKVIQDGIDLNKGKYPLSVDANLPFEIKFSEEQITLRIIYKDNIFNLEAKKGA